MGEKYRRLTVWTIQEYERFADEYMKTVNKCIEKRYQPLPEKPKRSDYIGDHASSAYVSEYEIMERAYGSEGRQDLNAYRDNQSAGKIFSPDSDTTRKEWLGSATTDGGEAYRKAQSEISAERQAEWQREIQEKVAYDRALQAYRQEVERIQEENKRYKEAQLAEANEKLKPLRELVSDMWNTRTTENGGLKINFDTMTVTKAESGADTVGTLKIEYPSAVKKETKEEFASFTPVKQAELTETLDSDNDDNCGYQRDISHSEPRYRDKNHIVAGPIERKYFGDLLERYNEVGYDGLTKREQLMLDTFLNYTKEVEAIYEPTEFEHIFVTNLHCEYLKDLRELSQALTPYDIKEFLKRKKKESKQEKTLNDSSARGNKNKVKKNKVKAQRSHSTRKRSKKSIGDVFGDVFSAIGDFFSAVGEFFGKVFSAIGRFFVGVWRFLVDHKIVTVITACVLVAAVITLTIVFYPKPNDDGKHMYDCGTVIAAADCTSTGVIEYKCVKHGETRRETLPIEHSYGTDNRCLVCGAALEYTTTLIYRESKASDNVPVPGIVITGITDRPDRIVMPPYIEGKPVVMIEFGNIYETLETPICFDTLEVHAPQGIKTSVEINTFDQNKKEHMASGAIFYGDYSHFNVTFAGAVNKIFLLGNIDVLNMWCTGKESLIITKDIYRIDWLYDLNSDSFALTPGTQEVSSDGIFYTGSQISNIYVPSDNQYFTSVDGVLYSKDKSTLYSYPTGRKVREYTICAETREIVKYAFCKEKKGKAVAMKYLALPDGIEQFTYHMREPIKKLILPGSVKSIGYETGSGNKKAVKQCKYIEISPAADGSEVKFDNGMSSANSPSENAKIFRKWIKKQKSGYGTTKRI